MNEIISIDLKDLKLLNSEEELSDSYRVECLILAMQRDWILWMECHKCGKSDYCKYAEMHPNNLDKKRERQCGVAEEFIKNFVTTTADKVFDLEDEKKQAWLNACYYLSQYVQSAEISIGTLANKDYIEFWGHYAPELFGYTYDTINYLNLAHKEMKHLTFFNSKRNLILVEGHSEEIFVKHFFPKIEIINYEGEGRIKYDKIEFLVKTYQQQGYNVFLQSDNDGNERNSRVNRIIKEGLIPKENIFTFKFDFETSIPTKIFHHIINMNDYIQDSFENFIRDYDGTKNIVKHTKEIYRLEDIKKRLIAFELCSFIDNIRPHYLRSRYMESESGKFLEFLRKII